MSPGTLIARNVKFNYPILSQYSISMPPKNVRKHPMFSGGIEMKNWLKMG